MKREYSAVADWLRENTEWIDTPAGPRTLLKMREVYEVYLPEEATEAFYPQVMLPDGRFVVAEIGVQERALFAHRTEAEARDQIFPRKICRGRDTKSPCRHGVVQPIFFALARKIQILHER